MQQPLRLSQRAIISVTGPEAEPFLNNILTASTIGLETIAYRYGALLTPQGKVIADMLIARGDDAILLDCARIAAPAVLKRLTLMKLRAAVSIVAREDLAVFAFAGWPDPRDPHAPRRRIAPVADVPHDDTAYHAARVAAGLSEQGSDFGIEEVFPADINMDLLGGIDFRKGCFVGQEVVSRMKRRGTARRRTLRAQASASVASPAPVVADGFEIGTLTSFSGGAGLARVRIDRLSEAEAAGQAITANGVVLTFDKPGWLAGELAALAAGKEAKA